MRKSLIVNAASTALLCFGISCGNKSSSGTQSTEKKGQLALSVTASNYKTPATNLNLAYNLAGDNGTPPFKATSIFSGAPETFTVYIKKIELKGTSGAEVRTVKVFEDTAGKALKIDGSVVDISDLFKAPTCVKSDGSPFELKAGEKCECGVDAQGNLVKKENIVNPQTGATELKCNFTNIKTPPVGLVDVTEANYTSLTVTYSKKASIKGCVGGFYRSNTTGIGDTAVAHRYCTRAEGGLFTGGSGVTLATFENKTSEEMDTPLTGVGGPNAFTAGQGDLDVNYDIASGLNIVEGKSSPLTLVIDTNRMLRFEAANRSDATVLADGWPKTRPYFFSTVFESSSFVYAGQPGTIRGYDWGAYVCTPSAAPCKGTGSVFYIAGWLTTIFDPAGTTIRMTYMPDDDSTLTVIKGSNIKQSAANGGAVTNTIDPEGFVKAAGGAVSLKYWLDNNSGTISLPKEAETVGELVEGTFAGFNSSGGEFTLTRRL